MDIRITPGTVPGEGILFVDHHAKRRSGHLGHALVEYADGCILAFYSNCAGSRNAGHSGFGWMEYKRSTDGGQTWSAPIVLDYAWDSFLDGMFTVSCEKAVRAADGTIVLVCLRNLCQPAWEPWLTPTVLRSADGGETWSEPVELTADAGRTYDLRVSGDGTIYALHFANDAKKSFCGNAPEHRYKLLVSTDNGKTFTERSVVPFDTDGRGYGSLMPAPDGRMIAYAYNSHNEYELDYCISHDDGMTWEQPGHCRTAKRIRNPQTAFLNGVYFLHGRSGVTPELPKNFVLYTSPDGLTWDEGVYLRVTPEGARGGASYYSNNLVTGTLGSGKRRLLIQSSDAYEEGRTDIRHWWIDVDD